MLKKISSVAVVFSLAVFLNLGCSTKSGKGAAIGAGSGAAVGAGIGALIGGKKGAMIGGASGAIVGGATGAAIGGYMDRQEAEMKKEVSNANIERVGNDLIVRFPSGILFDTGQAALKTASATDLSDFAGVLKDYPKTNIIIEGHTDSTGSRSLNERLSNSRAQSVQTFLAGQGVMTNRMSMVGYADARPVASNETVDGRAQNRRVEVKIVPDVAQFEGEGN